MENNYLSVTEYAAKVGREVSAVRRMLISGRLPGMKIGNQWIIAADTPLPADNRIKSGKYVKNKS